jgi:hypothetical protein
MTRVRAELEMRGDKNIVIEEKLLAKWGQITI